MLNFLLETIDAGVVGDVITNNNGYSGTLNSNNNGELTILFVLAIIASLILGIIIGYKIGKWFNRNDESDDE